jgi:predicted HicB family RNase H-like nuclease
MKEINEEFRYFCGPYKGYRGRAGYDADARMIHGEVLGARDMITFESETPGGLREAFKASVNDYLQFCESRGESPEKPFSGKFVMRISPELHRTLSMRAEQEGKSLNRLVREYLTSILEIKKTRPKRTAARTSEPVHSRLSKRKEAGGKGGDDSRLLAGRKKSARRQKLVHPKKGKREGRELA